jgi:hypothetical protein
MAQESGGSLRRSKRKLRKQDVEKLNTLSESDSGKAGLAAALRSMRRSKRVPDRRPAVLTGTSSKNVDLEEIRGASIPAGMSDKEKKKIMRKMLRSKRKK